MKRTVTLSLILGISVVVGFAPIAARAQTTAQQIPPVTLDLRDAPIYDALVQLFTNAKVDYSIDKAVQGYVTMKITDQPFRNALNLLLRSANPPLTYTLENGVYIVKPRTDPTRLAGGGAGGYPGAGGGAGGYPGAGGGVGGSDPDGANTAGTTKLDKITVVYADAADIAVIFGGGVLSIGAGRGNQGGGQGGGGFGGGQGGGGFGGGGRTF